MIEDFEKRLLTTFAGLPVAQFREDGTGTPADVEALAWRVGVEYYEGPGYPELFDGFLEHVETTRVRAFIIGNWNTRSTAYDTPASTFFEPFIAEAGRFPALEALFVGDIEQEQAEVSWIRQADVTPLFEAFPRLRVFGARGGIGLWLQPLRHAQLRELTFQTGGLPPAVVRAVGESDLPALNDLELYLGADEYGGGATAEDLAGILSGDRLPGLRYLGLRNAENIDELASAIAHAPVVARLEVLDLSLGNLSDEGAAALLAGQPLTHLKKLDLHHHYLSEEMQERIVTALPGVEVDLADVREPEDDGDEYEDDDEYENEIWRYIAVSE